MDMGNITPRPCDGGVIILKAMQVLRVLAVLMLVGGSGRAAVAEPPPTIAAEEAVAAPSRPTLDSSPPVSAKGANDSASAQGLAPFRFQLDARLGLGTLKVTADDSPMLNGLGLPLVLSAGLSLTRALGVFGEISDTHMLLFDTEASNGTSVFDIYGAGLGLKYYVTPNYFISGSASIARLQFQRGDHAMDISHWGKLARVSAGREWPVSPTWSVGVAGEYQVGAMQSGGLARGYPTDPPEKRYRFSGLSILVLASFHQAEASAPGTPAPPSSPSSFGLYLDMQVGMGRLWPRVGAPFWITGTSIPLALSAGIHVTKAVVLFGELSDIHMFGPSAAGGPLLYSLDLYGVGLGLKYYLTPRAWFLSVSASLAQLHYEGLTDISGSFRSETSRWGVLARMAVGREWPISPSWSLGAAGEVQWGTMDVGDNFQGKVYDGGEPTNGAPYTIKGLSLLGLATFNPSAKREPGEAEATSPVPAGYHTHDGVYANASVGPGWLWVTGRAPQELSGRGTSLALSAGYGFADHLVAFGEFSETKVNGPAGDTDAALEWYGFGPGLRYYLLPSNVFFSGSLLLSRVARSYPPPGIEGTDASTRPSGWGPTGQISAGKSWRLLGKLGVGIAAELGLGKVAGNGDWSTSTVKELSLLASVSFN